ncbi:hypothetical protein FisN_11Hh183 [Fistulifera solaris]|uniref:Tubby C-terminal domain-containing protein n=1 Tax=Fistulifera solaris TaxID=1519565 RepID=A0A1Z5JK23_FISSO|nr:hypothetical protein FisN_11Hh183 [Fistulifera solaris]|eukprot:GAX14360.1 hypothetical protein FisN_11Hh183 [Fistulifera solaris]
MKTTNTGDGDEEVFLAESEVFSETAAKQIAVNSDREESSLPDAHDTAEQQMALVEKGTSFSPEIEDTDMEIGNNSERSDEMAMGTAPCGIVCLPIDALHAVASFLDPSEWSEFALADKAACRVARAIVRRVRMHAFKCAVEAATAWKLGFQEDARELISLYISEGVPVYPRSYGHEHHTMLWRMQTEIRMKQEEENDESSFQVDPFYEQRESFREQSGGLSRDMTYLEVKALFLMHKESKIEPGLVLSRRDLSPHRTVVDSWYKALNADSPKDIPSHKRKLRLNIHQHLYDHHLAGRYAADDGGFIYAPVSLSVDFFHSNNTRRRNTQRGIFRPRSPHLEFGLLPAVAGEEEDENPFEPRIPNADLHAQLFAHAIGLARDARNQPHVDLFEPQIEPSPFKEKPVVDLVDTMVYSAATVLRGMPDFATGVSLSLDDLQIRFDSYERKLDALLAKNDNAAFDECLLDFWDEIFPSTAGIHYHDGHTAVPRLSSLQDFLTKPCPKAVGVVQCEIQRIKSPSRGKGVSVKGRFFPTYEYRLFIRDRPFAPLAPLIEEDYIRKDTVLLVARSRAQMDVRGMVPTIISKKGANNYFICLPEQGDLDAHFETVNNQEEGSDSLSSVRPRSVACVDDKRVQYLGRLQSNFIGTEFQIFSPCRIKPHAKKVDGNFGEDISPSTDHVPSRRSIFHFPLRRANVGTDMAADEPRNRHFFFGSPGQDMTGQARRSKRRAIAASTPEPKEDKEETNSTYVSEEEIGIIAYTANLLGSRPRTMDVCIPKVTTESSLHWKSYLEEADAGDDASMLSSLRKILQRIDAQERNPIADDGQEQDDVSDPNDTMGLTVLQNRPPWWNMELGSFVLNFGGRVSVASVKNFQLCERHDQDNILLQFGRIQGRHSFTMDFQHPLTAVQAFSIAISSLQSKITLG